MILRRVFFSACLAIVLCATAIAQSTSTWPTYRHDNRRSGVSAVQLSPPLVQAWSWKSPHLPQTAWTGPAKWDAYSSNAGLQSMRNFDPCFFVTGDLERIYFGSSVDDSAHALDLKTGDEAWRLTTGASVRFPPTLTDGKVLFGSDDGCVYCCDAKSGELNWKQRAAPNDRRIISNRKLISPWPVRSGVLVDKQRAIFAASLVPWEKSLLWSVDVATGNVGSPSHFRRELSDVTLQGALLASTDRLFIPQGRAAPLSFRRSDGKPMGAIGDTGGVFCVLTEDDKLFAGPPDQKQPENQIRVADLQSNQAIASFSGTDRILISGDKAWLAIEGKLKQLNQRLYVKSQHLRTSADRDMKAGKQPVDRMLKVIKIAEQRIEEAWEWSVECPVPLEMIKTAQTLYVGLPGQVRAFDLNNGSEVWRAEVEGSVFGLAVTGQHLLVSTDRGHIIAFTPKQPSRS